MHRPTERQSRATLKTVSELTGLSLSTISLALRGGDNLKKETRQLVIEAAAEVGYVPNRAGVRLRTGKTNVIALVLASGDGSIDFTKYLIQGIGHALKDTKFHFNVMPELDFEGSMEPVNYILNNRVSDGLIITNTRADDPRVKLLLEKDFPFVTHGRTEFFTPHPYNDFDSELFAKLSVERLVEKGCSNIMLAMDPDPTNNYHLILRSFEQAARAQNVRYSVRSIASQLDKGTVHQQVRQLGRSIASEADRPDGVVINDEMHAISLVSGLQDGGITPGENMQFVCKTTSDILSTLFPRIDIIEEDFRASGVELGNLLLRRINGEPAEDLQTLTAPKILWQQ